MPSVLHNDDRLQTGSESFVDLASVTEIDDEDNHLAFLDTQDYAVIPYPDGVEVDPH